MKSKYKKKIAGGIAKEFWNNTTELRLKLRILEKYLYDYTYLSEYKTTHDDLILLTKTDWAGIALYNCDIPISERRNAIYYYLGIGDFEHLESNSKEYQREYKLRTLKIK